MTTRSKILPTTVIAAALTVAAATAARAQPGDAPPRSPATPVVGAAEPLSATARAAIGEALEDERRGEAMYARVLKDHGERRPFSNVVRAERRHASLLQELLEARGLAVPPSTPPEAPRYATVAEARSAAVEYETRNAALYDRLLAAGPLPQDVKQVFDHNRAASLDRHRPAFERRAGLGAARGAGRGAGRGFGAGFGARFGRQAGPGCAQGCRCGCGHRECGDGRGPRGQASGD
jgi:hypothetical protein